MYPQLPRGAACLALTALLVSLLAVGSASAGGVLGLYMPRGNEVVVSEGASEVVIINLADGKVSATMTGDRREVHALAVSADGRFIAAAGRNGTALFEWTAFKKKLVPDWQAVSAKGVKPGDGQSAAFVGHTLVTLYEGVANAWDAETGKQLSLWFDKVSGGLGGEMRVPSVDVLTANPAGGTVAVGGGSSFSVRDAVSGKSLWRKWFSDPKYLGELKHPFLRSAAFSPDGKLLATGHADGFLRIWDAAAGELKDVRKISGDEVHCVTWSADGKLIATLAGKGEGRIWGAATGTQRSSFSQPALASVAFSPGGDRILAAARDGNHQNYKVNLDPDGESPKKPDLSAAGVRETGGALTRPLTWVQVGAMATTASVLLEAASEVEKKAPKTAAQYDGAAVRVVKLLVSTAADLREAGFLAAELLPVLEPTATRKSRLDAVTQFVYQAARQATINDDNSAAYKTGRAAGSLRALLLIRGELKPAAGEKTKLKGDPSALLRDVLASRWDGQFNLAAEMVADLDGLASYAGKRLKDTDELSLSAILDKVLKIDWSGIVGNE